MSSKRSFETNVVAFLAASGWPQKQIAESLGATQSGVSRMLQEAREAGILRTICRIDPGDLELVQDHLFKERTTLQDFLASLQPASQSVLRSVQVLPSDYKRGENNNQPSEFQAFATFASQKLESAIRQARIVGIGWGRTIAALCALPGFSGEARSKQDRLEFMFPLCGDPFNCPSIEYCASKNAANLNTNLGLDGLQSLSLSAIPARFPKRLTRSRIQIIREFMQHSSSYKRIFAENKGFLDAADCMIISGGTDQSRHRGDPIVGDLLGLEGLSEAALSRISSGDLAGALISRRGLSAADQRLVNGIASRWNGVSCSQLANCARRAAKSGSAGVIFFACGPKKTEIVMEAARNGLVNEIVIDESLARSLLIHANGDPARN